MCNQLIALAKIDSQRYIASCEHGITHVVWDHATMRFFTHDMTVIAELLHETTQLAVQYRIASKQAVTVILDQFDQFQIWLAGAGLSLNPDEFKLFGTMFQKAAKHPVVVEAEPLADTPRMVYQEERPHKVGMQLFSLN
ncbi:MAG: hypothetical protein AAF639_38950 [Chloroflexota bacterium]